jgi:predicted ATP-grasp superfamily ATP-dependent carboligase
LDGPPWIYTGGLENHLDLLDEWACLSVLYGNSGTPVKTVKSPELLAELLRNKHLQHPQVIFDRATNSIANLPELFERDEGTRLQWLLKPTHSSGGQGIRFWMGEVIPDEMYLQQFIDGESVSGIFICSDNGSEFAGATSQLVGESWLNAPSFHYCGSIGPLIEPGLNKSWNRIGELLCDAGLKGVVGVDAILSGEQLYVVEVNPRYTASVEVLELAERLSILDAHALAFAHKSLPLLPIDREKRCIGKAIYFAPFEFEFPEKGPWETDLVGLFDPWRIPNFADIPESGASFSKGGPVITILVAGASIMECHHLLRERSGEFGRLIH